MKCSVSFKIPALPPLLLNTRMNRWELNRLKKEWYLRVLGAVQRQKPPVPCHKAEILIVRRSSVEPDGDNAQSGGKWILDGLTRARIIEDDKPSVIGTVTYRWEKAAKGKGSVFVSVQGEYHKS